MSKYPIKEILKLSKDEYVIGKGGSTFCYRIENELNDWGNIHGSPAIKFGLYFGTYGDDQIRKFRIGRKECGSNENIALKKILTAIVELLENTNDFQILKNVPISPMYKGKLLSVYFPNDFLNIFSAKHLNYFINILSIDNDSRSELDKQALLLDYKMKDEVMKEWSIYEYSKFLYKSFGNPNDEIKENKIAKELHGFRLTDFPPIESLKFDYVNLQTNEATISSKIDKETKIDYSGRSKKFKQIGDRGEQIVMRAEKLFLEKNGKEDLAQLVDHISEKDDSKGYDILSYDLEGNEKHIEVKSTLKKIGASSIYITSNELAVSSSENNYYFYIVYEVGSNRPKIWKVKSSTLLNDNLVIKQPVLFKLYIHTSSDE